jgi:outer membrane protein assembly factor BamD
MLVTATAKRLVLLGLTGLFLLSASRCDAQILHKKKKVNKSTSADNNAEPDKILYNKAIEDIKHGRHEVGRLNMQTLINTYPDSEYLAKAKLAIADSFYKEGGTANLTQAVQGYKDFIVFFPFLQEASYAQLQVAMTHYKEMEKPDRDRTQARAAEEEFQTFLTKYPNDPLSAKAEQHLREVQEVLAEGDFRIGYYYYVKGDKKAAESRLRTVVNRYPLYSRADRTLWMLGNIWDGTEKKEFASNYYARIVRNYPLSSLVPDAKGRLKAMGAPVPQPDPSAVAWMTAEQNALRPHTSLAKKPMGFFKSGPGQELQVASQAGKPNLTPEAESESGTDILNGGNQTRIGGGTGIVATVTPGGSTGSTNGAENVAPSTDSGAPSTGTQADPNAPPTGDPKAPAAAADPNTAVTGTTDSAPKTDGTTDAAAQSADGAKTEAAAGQDAAQNGTNTDGKKESTSKKKKGLRKIVPW